jgi:hypothetical protein
MNSPVSEPVDTLNYKEETYFKKVFSYEDICVYSYGANQKQKIGCCNSPARYIDHTTGFSPPTAIL